MKPFLTIVFFALSMFAQAQKKSTIVLLDNYFNNEWRKAADGSLARYHYTWEDETMSGYSILGSIFQKQGAALQTLTEAPSANNLSSAGMYIIVDPDTEKETKQPNYIAQPHIDAIYNWVAGGGVLLLLANDSGNAELEHFNKLAQKFGIHFNSDSRNKVQNDHFESGTFSIPHGDSIFRSAKKIFIKEYASQTVSHPAKPVFTNGNLVVMSVAKVGRGAVFAVGDPWLYNEYTDGKRLPAELENYKAAEDLVRWALKHTNR